jgi:hypothetical protein
MELHLQLRAQPTADSVGPSCMFGGFEYCVAAMCYQLRFIEMSGFVLMVSFRLTQALYCHCTTAGDP